MMDKIYVNERCILAIEEKDRQYVLTLTNNDKIEKIYQSGDKSLVMKLMLDIANVKKSANNKYEPKNDISTPFKPSYLEKTVLMPGKIEKNIKKYDSVMNRIKDKAKLRNLPEDIKKDIETFKIKEAEILSALEESKKNGIDFYDYLKLTLEGMKERKGKDELNKKISNGEIDCETNTITTMRSKFKKSNKNEKKEVKVGDIIPNEELKNSEIHYVLNSKTNEDVSYLVVDNAEKSELLELKESTNNTKANNPEDMFQYNLIGRQKYRNETEKNKILLEMKDDVDSIVEEEESEETKNNVNNEIKSIDAYFNNSLDSIMNDYKEAAKESKNSVSSPTDKVKSMLGEIEDYEFEVIVYVGKEKLPIVLYSNEEVSLKDTTGMKFVETFKNNINFTFSNANDIVTLGYDKYVDANGNDYYVAFIKNEGEDPQLVFGHTDLIYINQFIENVSNIIKSL